MTIFGTTCIILSMLLLIIFMIYNNLVKKKNFMKEAWSGIEVYLKKRYELVPNLVETVKAYAKHEKDVMEQITLTRTAAIQSADSYEKAAQENSFTQAIGQLLVVAENYPELKANTNFQQLQSQLEVIESEIELSRRYYNGTVREYNILVQSFPAMILANALNFKTERYFEIENPEERNPKNVAC